MADADVPPHMTHRSVLFTRRDVAGGAAALAVDNDGREVSQILKPAWTLHPSL